jgi:Fe-S cluster assembly protein SufD
MKRNNSMPAWLQTPAPDAITPSWLADYRQTHWDALQTQGLPTRHHERWKYTDLSFLAKNDFQLAQPSSDTSLASIVSVHQTSTEETIFLVFINGYFAPHLSDLTRIPTGVVICSMAEAFQQHAALIDAHWPAAICTKRHPFAGMNAAHFSDGMFVYVPAQMDVGVPIHLLSIAANQQSFAAQPRHLIVLGKQSKLTLWEEYAAATSAPYLTNSVTNMVIGEHATLEHYKLQNEQVDAIHMASTFIHQQQDSRVTATYFSAGSQFARDDVMVRLQESGAVCSVAGFYRLRRDEQYVDYHIDIEHAAPRSSSEMLYKGILDKKSRAVFNGRLHVEQNAQKILAYQANHNLLLSNEAEVNSKPELEIYADDVKCKHGATTGQLDQDALFYMQARGIQRVDAVNILLKGFSDEILQRVKSAEMKTRIEALVYYS